MNNIQKMTQQSAELKLQLGNIDYSKIDITLKSTGNGKPRIVITYDGKPFKIQMNGFDTKHNVFRNLKKGGKSADELYYYSLVCLPSDSSSVIDQVRHFQAEIIKILVKNGKQIFGKSISLDEVTKRFSNLVYEENGTVRFQIETKYESNVMDVGVARQDKTIVDVNNYDDLSQELPRGSTIDTIISLRPYMKNDADGGPQKFCLSMNIDQVRIHSIGTGDSVSENGGGATKTQQPLRVIHINDLDVSLVTFVELKPKKEDVTNSQFRTIMLYDGSPFHINFEGLTARFGVSSGLKIQSSAESAVVPEKEKYSISAYFSEEDIIKKLNDLDKLFILHIEMNVQRIFGKQMSKKAIFDKLTPIFRTSSVIIAEKEVDLHSMKFSLNKGENGILCMTVNETAVTSIEALQEKFQRMTDFSGVVKLSANYDNGKHGIKLYMHSAVTSTKTKGKHAFDDEDDEEVIESDVAVPNSAAEVSEPASESESESVKDSDDSESESEAVPLQRSASSAPAPPQKKTVISGAKPPVVPVQPVATAPRKSSSSSAKK
jgi:hypothetical protein